MSGHSKWATTKRQKAVVDAKRGAIFTKIGNIITIAAREKGADPNANFSLRIAMEKARAANMPKENVERAIKRGTGEIGGAQIEEHVYEGFGPAKTQFVVKSLTDNKNRSAAAIRHLFTESGGGLGAVLWNFEQKGVIRIGSAEFGVRNWDDLELGLIDAGVQDIEREDEGVTLYNRIEDLQKVKQFLDAENVPTESADIEYVAKNKINLAAEDKEKVEQFIEELENSEDVSEYYTNVNI